MSSCGKSFPPIAQMPLSILVTLRMFNAIIASLNILGNGFLIYALKKTGQTRTISIKFVVFMSISDLIAGIFGLLLISLLLWEEFYNYCSLRLATLYIMSFANLFSILMIALVALDRYFHMRYLESYPTIITKQRGYSMVSGCFCVTVTAIIVQSLLSIFGEKVVMILRFVTAMIWFPLFVTIASLYYKAYRRLQLKASSQMNQIVKRALSEGKRFARIGTLVVTFTGLLTLPLVLYIALYFLNNHKQFITPASLNGCLWFAILIFYANAFCSSIIFIMQNRNAKRFLKGVLKRNTVHTNSLAAD